MINSDCKFVKTSKRFRPYGTTYHLPIKGKAKVTLQAERGASIETWAYIVDNCNGQSLLGEADAVRLGIVKLNLEGATEENIQKISYVPKSPPPTVGIISGGQTQDEIDSSMKDLVKEFSGLFSDHTGKYNGKPIKIHFNRPAIPVIQPQSRIPLHYVDRLK